MIYFFLSLVWAPQAFAARPVMPSAVWQFEGRWRAGDLVLTISPARGPEGTLSVDGGTPRPARGTSVFPNGDIQFAFRDPDITIALRTRPDGGALDAAIERDGRTSSTVFAREPDPSAPRRPQTPRPPHPYNSYDLGIDTGAGVIAGTLTVPTGDGPFPAIVLFAGTGSQDRDASYAGHRPFFVIADHLTRRGFATLRLDERGSGHSSGLLGELRTVAADAGDARAAIEVLRAQPEIDRSRIGILGHSEGGLVAAAAAGRIDVAFVVLMGAPAMDGIALALLQHESIERARGATEARITFERDVRTRVYDVIQHEPDHARARRAIAGVIAGSVNDAGWSLPWLVDFSLALKSATGRHYDAFRERLLFDPLPSLRALHVPTLALFAGLDVQVPADSNASLTQKAIAGSSPLSKVETLKGLNHAFQTADTGAVEEYARIEETIAPRALEVISTWLRQVTEK